MRFAWIYCILTYLPKALHDPQLAQIHEGRVMTADSRFTSIPLAIDLLQQNCKLLGTIVKKPEIPSDLKDSKRTQAAGSTSFLYSKKKKRSCMSHVSHRRTRSQCPSFLWDRSPSMGEMGRAVLQHYNHTKGRDVYLDMYPLLSTAEYSKMDDEFFHGHHGCCQCLPCKDWGGQVCWEVTTIHLWKWLLRTAGHWVKMRISNRLRRHVREVIKHL